MKKAKSKRKKVSDIELDLKYPKVLYHGTLIIIMAVVFHFNDRDVRTLKKILLNFSVQVAKLTYEGSKID